MTSKSHEASSATHKELARLKQHVTQLTSDLSDAQEREAATSAILGVISHAWADPQLVFEAIVTSTARLCEANFAALFLYDGEVLTTAAHTKITPEFSDYLKGPRRPGPETTTKRAALERRPVHVADLLADPEFAPTPREIYERENVRTVLSVPMLRNDALVGVITAWRREVRPFSAKQIELVETFANQAVIAIENGRLFGEIEEKSLQLEVVSRHKSEFLANMSHELRTPLNAIIGFSEVLSEKLFGDLNDKQEEYLQDILTSGRHLLSLINDILDLSKVEAGQMDLELGRFSLAETLENGLSMIKERAGRHGIALSLEIDPGLDEIEADERKIKQVLFNLLSNAIKFTPDGGRIDVTAQSAGNIVEVAVRDAGIGIAAEDQERIFEEFRQVGAGVAKTEGTGLGLALTRKLVELHGGRIWVESEIGLGSTFTFSLPLRHSVQGASSTVLAIDDDPLAVELMEAVLAPQGYTVLKAAGGEAGLDLARRERPGLIILDLLMPGTDGYAVVDQLKAQPATADTPIIVLTARSLTEAEKKRLHGQISHLAQKGDFDRAGFLELVRRFCSPANE